MYVLPAGMSARSTIKWGLGGFQLRKGLDIAGTMLRRRGQVMRRGLRGLGDAILDPGNMLDTGITLPGGPGEISPWFFDVPNTQTPQQPGVAPTTQQSIADAYKQVQQAAITSMDPLDYVSPQAAIAAGVPAQTAYNAWSASMARFPTQQAALAAGVPAGVVTQLWAQSRAAAPSTSFFDGSTFGVSNKVLAMGAGGIALLALLGGRRR